MSWAHPAALWLLAAAPLPVVLHLLGRVRPRVLEFPGAFLLRQLEARRRSLRLRHLLLLALRVAAICVAVLALAGPRLDGPVPLLAEAREATVIVDASASMAMASGRPWRRAMNALDRLQAAAGAALMVRAEPLVAASATAAKSGARRLKPTRLQGAPGDAAWAAAAAGRQPLVLTDMDVSSVLPRRWPPRSPPGRVVLVDCGPPEPAAAFDAWLQPGTPPADALALLAARTQRAEPLALRGAARMIRPCSHFAATAERCAVKFQRPGLQELAVGAGASEQLKLSVAVPQALNVAVVGGAEAARYLQAAADPLARGQPLRVVRRLPAGLPPDVVLGCTDVPPPHALDAPTVLFIAPGAQAKPWADALAAAGWPPLRAAGEGKAADEAGAGILIASDCPPALAWRLGELKDALAQAGVHRWCLVEPGHWQVVARLSDGAPAVVYCQRPRPALVFAFGARPQDAEVVASGAFAALVHAAVMAVAPATAPAGDDTRAETQHSAGTQPKQASAVSGPQDAAGAAASATTANPPPAEMAAVRADAEELQAAWGGRAAVLDAAHVERALRLSSDLVPLGALVLLAVVAAEWLLAGAISAADARGGHGVSAPGTTGRLGE